MQPRAYTVGCAWRSASSGATPQKCGTCPPVPEGSSATPERTQPQAVSMLPACNPKQNVCLATCCHVRQSFSSPTVNNLETLPSRVSERQHVTASFAEARLLAVQVRLTAVLTQKVERVSQQPSLKRYKTLGRVFASQRSAGAISCSSIRAAGSWPHLSSLQTWSMRARIRAADIGFKRTSCTGRSFKCVPATNSFTKSSRNTALRFANSLHSARVTPAKYNMPKTPRSVLWGQARRSAPNICILSMAGSRPPQTALAEPPAAQNGVVTPAGAGLHALVWTRHKQSRPLRKKNQFQPQRAAEASYRRGIRPATDLPPPGRPAVVSCLMRLTRGGLSSFW
eukprot:363870-Chlamydomonas_euryale.AAC.5